MKKIILLTLLSFGFYFANAQCFVSPSFTQSNIGLTTNFTNTTNCNSCISVNYTWYFGDGNSSSQINPSHTYAAPGNYFVSLWATAVDSGSNTCVDSFHTLITVGNTIPCNTNISIAASGTTIFSSATASGGTAPYTYSYTLYPSNITNSSGTFSGLTNGAYTVCVTATDANNIACSTACDSTNIYVASNCMANLTSSTSGGSHYNFNTTVSGGVAPYTYTYNFGDGTPTQSSTLPNINHSYATGGTFYPCVTIIDSLNNSCTSCDTIIVSPPPCGMVAGFSQSTTGLTTSFTNTTTCSSCSTISYYWYFGDGNNSSLPSPTHTYTTPGNYFVSLWVTAVDSANNTCVDSIQATINVQIPPPCQIYMSTVVNQLTAQFTPVVTNATAPLTYFYTYGDGTNGTSNIHTYPSAGTYHPCLTVTDANNDSCTYCDTLIITNQPCNTSLFTNVSGNNIIASANGSWGTAPYTYTYILNPGNITNNTGVFSNMANGTYTICATATDANNTLCTTTCDSVNVLVGGPCFAQLSSITSGNVTSFATNVSGPAWMYYYSYNFGDGSPIQNSASPNAIHTYSTPGWYYPCVTAVDTVNNISCIACDSVYIGSFSACYTNLTTTVSGNTIYSSASATGGTSPYSYSYTLLPGNITNSTGIFASLPNGQYIICATATDAANQICNSWCDSVVIGSSLPCNTNISVSANGNTILATATASGGTTPYTFSYTLNPGNITNSTGLFPSLPNGYYVVCVSATDSLNQVCSTDCDSIQLGNTPGNCFITAAFTESIAGLNVAFTNNTTITNGTIVNYGWSFGDGNAATIASPSHTYTSPGTYTVVLAAYGQDSLLNPCVDSISKTIYVGPTSVNNAHINKLTIYPNPTSKNILIELPTNEKLDKLVITDVSGRIVHTNYKNIGNKKLQISLVNEASGIYFIKLLTDKNIYTSSIMKQE